MIINCDKRFSIGEFELYSVRSPHSCKQNVVYVDCDFPCIHESDFYKLRQGEWPL